MGFSSYNVFLFSAGLHKSSYALSVYQPADTTLSAGEVVVFERKLLDEGGMYDTTTGKYNVPVSGLFYFTANLCSKANDYGSVNFEANGIRFGSFNFGDKSYDTCSTGSAIAKLQKNTKVWLKAVNPFVATTDEANGRFNYFSGYLIKENH